MNVKTKTIIYKKGYIGSKSIESIVKDGSNYIKKYAIMGFKSEIPVVIISLMVNHLLNLKG